MKYLHYFETSSEKKIDIPIGDLFRSPILRARQNWGIIFSKWLQDVIGFKDLIEFKANTSLNRERNSTVTDKKWHKGTVKWKDIKLSVWEVPPTKLNGTTKQRIEFSIGIDFNELSRQYYVDIDVPIYVYKDSLPKSDNFDFDELIKIVKREKITKRFDL